VHTPRNRINTTPSSPERASGPHDRQRPRGAVPPPPDELPQPGAARDGGARVARPEPPPATPQRASVPADQRRRGGALAASPHPQQSQSRAARGWGARVAKLVPPPRRPPVR